MQERTVCVHEREEARGGLPTEHKQDAVYIYIGVLGIKFGCEDTSLSGTARVYYTRVSYAI